MRPKVSVAATVLAVIAGVSGASAMECTQFVKQQITAAHPTENFSALTVPYAYQWYAAAKSVQQPPPYASIVSSTPVSGYVMVFAGSAQTSNSRTGDGRPYPTTVYNLYPNTKNAAYKFTPVAYVQDKKTGQALGHVALVRTVSAAVNGTQNITVDQANWHNDGSIQYGTAVTSTDKWVTAEVWWSSTTGYGLPYAVTGFINTNAFPLLKKK